MNKIQEIKELVQELNKYSHEYYVLDNPSISDIEYDQKYNKLLNLEKDTGYFDQNSPTQRIGDIVLDKFNKVQHKNKLWSLDKAQTIDELLNFHKNNIAFVRQHNLTPIQYVVTKKFDGLTIKTEYDNTQFIQGSTRGTGEIGEDTTEQIKTIIGVPLTIKSKENIAFHGEALMTKKAFEEYNKTAESPLKNLRNGASGALRNLNVKETAKRKLSAFFYNINQSNIQFNTYSEQLDFIKENGLPCDEYKICNTIDEVIKEIKRIESIRSELQYDIDGVVVSINNMKTRELLGYTIKFPKHSIAFKFEAQESTTTILNVEFNTGRTGKVTPRAIVEPVELCGVTVKYATLNNMDDIKRKGVKLGGRVFIRRSNDVIPEITGNSGNEGIEIKIPTHCNSCGSPLVKDGVHYFCTNSLSCKPQLVKGIVHFCQREAMNIEGFSEKTAEQFIDNNIISNVVDLYNLQDKKKDIVKLEKFGLKKYNNLIESINRSKQCKLHSFIYGLGIENVGNKTSKDLVKHFKTLDNIKKTTFNELIKIDDIGDIVANSIIDWFKSEKNILLLEELLTYIEFIEDKPVETNNQSLQGKTFVITGEVHIFKNRNEVKDKIESLGGKVSGSVSKNTNWLINNDTTSTSGKNKKAKELNIPIISEEEFLQMIK